MSQQCKCKKGHASLIDGKCSNCRTKKEQQAWLNRPSRELQIVVANKHHKQSGEYIGRGSPLGNPYPIDNTKGDTRKVVIDKYRHWIKAMIDSSDPKVCNELNRLAELARHGELRLQCFCAPLPCHGDIIKDVLFKAISKTYTDTHWWIS